MSSRGEAVALAIVALSFLLAGGFAIIPPHGVFRDPVSHTKTWGLVAILLTAIAAPIAFAESRSDKRLEKVARRVRAERMWLVESDYVGPEGTGRLFEAPGRRVLVLRALGGIGKPVVLRERVAATAEADLGAPGEVEVRLANE